MDRGFLCPFLFVSEIVHKFTRGRKVDVGVEVLPSPFFPFSFIRIVHGWKPKLLVERLEDGIVGLVLPSEVFPSSLLADSSDSNTHLSIWVFDPVTLRSKSLEPLVSTIEVPYAYQLLLSLDGTWFYHLPWKLMLSPSHLKLLPYCLVVFIEVVLMLFMVEVLYGVGVGVDIVIA